MLSLSFSDSPFSEDQPPYAAITRIELFVIPALAIDSDGYRVCLRLTSDIGIGWSELFVSDSDHNTDLEHWSNTLQPYIGRISFAAIETVKADPTDPRKRPFLLFAAAVNHLKFQSDIPSKTSSHSEEPVLRNRAIAYFSLE